MLFFSYSIPLISIVLYDSIIYRVQNKGFSFLPLVWCHKLPESITSSFLCNLHWSQMKTRLTLPAFRHLGPITWIAFFILRSTAGWASIGLVMWRYPMTSWAGFTWRLSENREFTRNISRNRLWAKMSLSENSRYFYAIEIAKKTAMPGFEPSTLRMTRLLWD